MPNGSARLPLNSFKFIGFLFILAGWGPLSVSAPNDPSNLPCQPTVLQSTQDRGSEVKIVGGDCGWQNVDELGRQNPNMLAQFKSWWRAGLRPMTEPTQVYLAYVAISVSNGPWFLTYYLNADPATNLIGYASFWVNTMVTIILRRSAPTVDALISSLPSQWSKFAIPGVIGSFMYITGEIAMGTPYYQNYLPWLMIMFRAAFWAKVPEYFNRLRDSKVISGNQTELLRAGVAALEGLMYGLLYLPDPVWKNLASVGILAMGGMGWVAWGIHGRHIPIPSRATNDYPNSCVSLLIDSPGSR